MASNISPNPHSKILIFMYFPPNVRPGSNTIASMVTVTGMKQAINKVDIITTILAILWLRLDDSPGADFTFCLCHFVLFCRLRKRRPVQMITTMKAMQGMKKLLIVNTKPSTTSLSAVEIRPTMDLFLAGTNFRPSLLTTYTGASHAM